MPRVRTNPPAYVGVAGWAVPKPHAAHFPEGGSHLERYAAVFPAVEINSSFYKPHQPKTYAKWAAAVPAGFRFSVKAPKEATHAKRLEGADDVMARFLDEAANLGDKLGPVLVQLPPSLAFSAEVAGAFFDMVRERHTGDVVCEPRHRSWFTPAAEKLLTDHRVARVVADPAVVPEAAEQGGWDGLAYYRLHGSPKIYYSAYSGEYLEALAVRLANATVPTWCIFDNTALFEATANALTVLDRLCEE